MIPELKPIVKTEIKPLDLKYEDVVFEGTDSSDDHIPVDDASSDAEIAVFDNMLDNETTLPENLLDAETELYSLSDAKTIYYTSDIEFIENE